MVIGQSAPILTIRFTYLTFNIIHHSPLEPMPSSEDARYPNVATLNGSLAGLLTSFLDQRGLAARACRARLALWRQDGRIPVTEWAACLQLIARECPEPALGLAIGRHLELEHVGLLAYLVLACDDMSQLVDQLQRFHGLMWQGFDVRVTRSSGTLTLSWTPLASPPPAALDLVRLAYETGIAGIVQVFRTLCGDEHSPKAVMLLGAPPADTGPYEAFFRAPVTFSAHRADLVFDIAIQDQPLRTRDTVLRQLVARQAEARLRAFPPGDAFLSSFQQALEHAIRTGMPTLDRVAVQLGTSRITLQRRLAERGLGFQQLLDRMRLEMARMYIEDPRLSLAEIALLLAFSEQSAFCRAFRRWTGETPLRMRRRLLAPARLAGRLTPPSTPGA